ncbi:hypothetical protein BDW62DRAFT_198771 [Aspergillus aurantiobrunneus]
METISQAVHNASNALWNEVDMLRGRHQQTGQTTEQRAQQHGEEPISGIQGKGTAKDPYDAGNRDEQPEAPNTKDNTGAATEPVSSTIGGTFNDRYRRQSENTVFVASGLDPPNPSVEHASGTAAKSTLKDEPLSTHRRTLKDDSISGAGPAPDEPETTTSTHPSAAAAATAAAASTTGSTAAEPPSEQRSQPSTEESQTQSQNQEGADTGESSTAGGTTPHKQKVSEEALKGPKCPPPRESYERQMRSADAGRKKEGELKDQPKTAKPEGTSNEKSGHGHHGKDNKTGSHEKEILEHHHKTMKERLNNVLHHH